MSGQILDNGELVFVFAGRSRPATVALEATTVAAPMALVQRLPDLHARLAAEPGRRGHRSGRDRRSGPARPLTCPGHPPPPPTTPPRPPPARGSPSPPAP